jgi:hypothetical protein
MGRAQTTSKPYQFVNHLAIVLREPQVENAIRHAISKHCPTESLSAIEDQLEKLFLIAAGLVDIHINSDSDDSMPAIFGSVTVRDVKVAMMLILATLEEEKGTAASLTTELGLLDYKNFFKIAANLLKKQYLEPSASHQNDFTSELVAATLAKVQKELDLQASAPAQLDPISLLKKQSAERHDKLIESGQLVTAEILAQMLSVTTKAISKALCDNRFFFVASRGVRNYFPAFFADPQYDRRQIEAVSKAMGDVPGSAKYAFFVTPKLTLDGKTPLEALAEGQLHKVLDAAQGYIER